MSLLRSKSEKSPPRSGREDAIRVATRQTERKFGVNSRELAPTGILVLVLTYLRYALATCCFAASVGGLALWSLSESRRVIFRTPHPPDRKGVICESGYATMFRYQGSGGGQFSSVYVTEPRNAYYDANLQTKLGELGRFGASETELHFPLWYPALIFALAGIASLRLGRRFTIRSAIIATTVVAGMLGVAVGL